MAGASRQQVRTRGAVAGRARVVVEVVNRPPENPPPTVTLGANARGPKSTDAALYVARHMQVSTEYPLRQETVHSLLPVCFPTRSSTDQAIDVKLLSNRAVGLPRDRGIMAKPAGKGDSGDSCRIGANVQARYNTRDELCSHTEGSSM